MIAIIVVGYNRPNSISRLLQTVGAADYNDDVVDLIVSIDKSEKEHEIVKIVEQIEWSRGKKLIRTFNEKQGLRKHILKCGDYTNDYEAIIVLEDDIIVSKSFYLYAKNAIDFYKDEKQIAGISLYSYGLNEFCEKSFIPSYNGYDTFLLQVAQSWGQCWTKSMWKEFRKWPYSDTDSIPFGKDMPNRVFRWGPSSWKKNYMAYLVRENKYFVYPYVSYTTNISEVGTHRKFTSSSYQVPMVDKKNEWTFSPCDLAIKYDVFFERESLNTDDGRFSNLRVAMDLYGLKTDFSNYDVIVSSQELKYEIIDTIGLTFRPHEMNFQKMVLGDEIFIYDLHKPRKIKQKQKRDTKAKRYEYYTLGSNWNFSIDYFLFGLKRAFLRKLSGK